MDGFLNWCMCKDIDEYQRWIAFGERVLSSDNKKCKHLSCQEVGFFLGVTGVETLTRNAVNIVLNFTKLFIPIKVCNGTSCSIARGNLDTNTITRNFPYLISFGNTTHYQRNIHPHTERIVARAVSYLVTVPHMKYKIFIELRSTIIYRLARPFARARQNERREAMFSLLRDAKKIQIYANQYSQVFQIYRIPQSLEVVVFDKYAKSTPDKDYDLFIRIMRIPIE